MKISPTTNHGKTRWRLNVQRGPYRKRLFFETLEAAEAFAIATGGRYTLSSPTQPPTHYR